MRRQDPGLPRRRGQDRHAWANLARCGTGDAYCPGSGAALAVTPGDYHGGGIMTRTNSQPYPSTPLDIRKFTYRELLEMERAGIIQEDQHVELLGGQLVVMTIHPPHAAAVSHLNRRFQRVFADRAQVITQSP